MDLIADGLLVGNDRGKIEFVGERKAFKGDIRVPQAAGIIMPPMLDAHIHISQWPIRGKFCDDVSGGGNGRLIAGLEKNVFPEEARDAEDTYAAKVVEQFRADTLAQGVVGGAAYMTVHPSATRIALGNLGEHWSVGMVLMDQNCPEYLRTDLQSLDRDIEGLARDFGKRFIITDRFAVSVSSELRQRAAKWATQLSLSRQTHLNEQRGEKELVEKKLYSTAESYADVYRRDGLFDGPCLCAHCVWMREQEWAILRDCGCAVAHCPSSNTLLGSGIMDLEQVKKHEIPWSICTDVGAGPSTSLLAEMVSFLMVHEGRHNTSAEEALWGVTLGAARVLKQDRALGRFEKGMDYSFVDVDLFDSRDSKDHLENAEQFIRQQLLGMREEKLEADLVGILNRLHQEGLEDQPCLETLQRHLAETVARLEGRVQRVTLKGQEVFAR
ncbi:MAG TPA: amidohydrolase family protein [Tepidisphaeraceae bacterium]